MRFASIRKAFADGLGTPRFDSPAPAAIMPPPNRIATAEELRAERIERIAEEIYLRHLGDPEDAYAAAVRWVDSRVAVALAGGRDPGPAARDDNVDSPELKAESEQFLIRYGVRCRSCPVHAELYPASGECPICAEPERRKRFDEEIAAAREKRRELSPEEPALPTDSGQNRASARLPGPDIARLLSLAELLNEFDAHQLVNLAHERDPELASRIDARKANDHLRRAAAAGHLEAVTAGKRGPSGHLPTYRLAPSRALVAGKEIVAPLAISEVSGDDDADDAPGMATPREVRESERIAPAQNYSGSMGRCMVHGTNFPEDSVCPECVRAPRVPARPARR